MKVNAEPKEMTIEVLLVEDSPGDIRLMQEVFRVANSLVRLHVATDGVQAMGFLRQWGEHANCPRPDLILLDLNLPKMGGLEVLEQIQVRRRPQDHSDGHSDHLGGGGRHRQGLSPAGQLLPAQAGASGGL